MCVNLSARQLRQPDLVGQVMRVLHETGLGPADLQLEVTERVIAEEENAIATLGALKDLGVQLAIDDFGTGYSSLSSLRRLPIDTLKVDPSFAQELTRDAGARAVMRAVTSLAHELGMHVVSEGIETAADFEVVRSLGVDIGQGYYFGRAVPAADLAEWLKQGRWHVGMEQQPENWTAQGVLPNP
ncbi:MAG TPA: EAL domain-containing protein [Thermomicrobiales bacterium]|nr:EAL domain-containing protein [Thermomicrobiales bacterium]